MTRLRNLFRSDPGTPGEYHENPFLHMQAGLLITPMRQGNKALMRPVSPQGLQAMHTAKLITDFEYQVMMQQLMGPAAAPQSAVPGQGGGQGQLPPPSNQQQAQQDGG